MTAKGEKLKGLKRELGELNKDLDSCNTRIKDIKCELRWDEEISKKENIARIGGRYKTLEQFEEAGEIVDLLKELEAILKYSKEIKEKREIMNKEIYKLRDKIDTANRKRVRYWTKLLTPAVLAAVGAFIGTLPRTVTNWLNNQQKNEPEVIENSRSSSNNSSDRVTHDSEGLGMTDSNIESLHGSNADAALGEVGAIGVDKDLKSTLHSDQ